MGLAIMSSNHSIFAKSKNRLSLITDVGKKYSGLNNSKSPELCQRVIAFFDCLHDMGDPIGAIQYAKTKLNANGIIMLVEPTADDLPENNFNLIGQMYYSFSTIACIPASKSQEVGLALGAQAGPKKLFSILNQAGFRDTKVTYKTASNMVIQGRLLNN